MLTRSFRAAFLLGLIATSACGEVTAVERRMGIAQARWQDNRPFSYRFTLRRSCECSPEMIGPVVVEVTNNVVTSRTYTITGAAVGPSALELFPSIDGLFEVVDAALREDAAQLGVAYDPTWGYPTHISIDYRADMVDDEVLYVVSGFEPRQE